MRIVVRVLFVITRVGNSVECPVLSSTTIFAQTIVERQRRKNEPMFSLLISAFDAVLLPSLRAAGDPAAGSIAASSVPQSCTAWHG